MSGFKRVIEYLYMDIESSNMELFVQAMKSIVEIIKALEAQQYMHGKAIVAQVSYLTASSSILIVCNCRLINVELKMKEKLHNHYFGLVHNLLNKAISNSNCLPLLLIQKRYRSDYCGGYYLLCIN